jgi:hypothetical protein
MFQVFFSSGLEFLLQSWGAAREVTSCRLSIGKHLREAILHFTGVRVKVGWFVQLAPEVIR